MVKEQSRLVSGLHVHLHGALVDLSKNWNEGCQKSGFYMLCNKSNIYQTTYPAVATCNHASATERHLGIRGLRVVFCIILFQVISLEFHIQSFFSSVHLPTTSNINKKVTTTTRWYSFLQGSCDELLYYNISSTSIPTQSTETKYDYRQVHSSRWWMNSRHSNQNTLFDESNQESTEANNETTKTSMQL